MSSRSLGCQRCDGGWIAAPRSDDRFTVRSCPVCRATKQWGHDAGEVHWQGSGERHNEVVDSRRTPPLLALGHVANLRQMLHDLGGVRE